MTSDELRKLADEMEEGTDAGDEMLSLDPICALRAAADEIDSLTARVAELERDAKRYRWLRGFSQSAHVLMFWNDIGCAETPDDLDAAIDAAMEEAR